LLYKPWRRRVDKKRLGNAHFEPLPNNSGTAVCNEEEQQVSPTIGDNRTKDVDVVVQSVEVTDLAGPAHR
jgi:high-affinity nickel-transport protein